MPSTKRIRRAPVKKTTAPVGVEQAKVAKASAQSSYDLWKTAFPHPCSNCVKEGKFPAALARVPVIFDLVDGGDSYECHLCHIKYSVHTFATQVVQDAYFPLYRRHRATVVLNQ